MRLVANNSALILAVTCWIAAARTSPPMPGRSAHNHGQECRGIAEKTRGRFYWHDPYLLRCDD